MIIYKVGVYRMASKYFFSIEEAERQIEKWRKEGFVSFTDIEEIFVHGHNPFLNNQELID